MILHLVAWYRSSDRAAGENLPSLSGIPPCTCSCSPTPLGMAITAIWSRIHLDFAGPFLGRMFLVLVDAHSKWIDVQMMTSITSTKTIEKLWIIFADHGLPRKVVTDNGSSFTSEEFKSFLSQNGIVHVTTAPLSNGLAERAVQTFKKGLKRTPGATIQEKLSKILFTYRITWDAVYVMNVIIIYLTDRKQEITSDKNYACLIIMLSQL